MRVLGIDPGVGDSHAVVIERVDGRDTLRDAFTLPTPLRLDAPAVQGTLGEVAGHHLLHLAVVEVARGEVYAGRSGDGVLVNNLIAGILAGTLAAEGVPTVCLPPSGHHLGFNWRGELGARSHTDAGVREAVTRLLGDDARDLPTGARGGVIAHYWDAAGIALAALERCTRRGLEPGPGLPAAFLMLDALEEAQRDNLARQRAARASTRRTRRKAGPA